MQNGRARSVLLFSVYAPLRHGRLACVLLLLLARAAAAQPLPEGSEKQLITLKEQLAADQRRLADAAEDEQSTRNTLESLDREIATREALSVAYRRHLEMLSLRSDSLSLALRDLESEVDTLKTQYRARALHAYKYGRLNDLALLLSAESINQMLVRSRYLARFSDQRNRKLARIRRIRESLDGRRSELDATHARTSTLLAQARAEETDLVRLRKQREELVATLRIERKELERAVARKRAERQALETLMQRLAATEDKRMRTPSAAAPAANAAFATLSGSFAQNKGRLPWPATGALLEPYGDRINPLLGTTTDNPGILIATAAAAPVYAVFDGEVILVEKMPDFGTIVAIAHGEYKSVYSNFSSLAVHVGQRVKAGDAIGRAGTDGEPRGAGIFFALFRKGGPVDPLPWLLPR